MGESVDSVPQCTEPTDAPKRCAARLRGKGGKTCQRWGLAPSGRCALHGNASPRGSDHPSFIHGAYSAALPKSLRRDFARYLNDPGLISAKSELAVLRTRLTTLVSRLESGETADAWGRLLESLRLAREACEARDIDAIRAAVGKASEITTDAANREQAADAYTTLVERFTVVAAREARRLVEAKMVCSVETVNMIVRSLVGCVLRHCDAGARAAIADAVDRMRLLPSSELDELASGAGETSSVHGQDKVTGSEN